MTSLATRLGLFLTLALTVLVASTGPALAHTGEDANNKHIFFEFGLWGLGLAGALALVVLVFWIRARLRESRTA